MVGANQAEDMGAFLDACGATGPLRLDLAFQGAAGGERRAFHQPFLLIGRHADADLCLDHERVGRRHAYLQLIGGRLFCVDLESRTGTSLPGGAEGSGWVERAAQLEIGPATLRLRDGGRDRAGPEGEPSPLSRLYVRRNPLPGARLEISGNKKKPASWPISRALILIGDSPLCKVRLKSPGASRFYCSLIRTPQGIWMVDLLATECVLVNGESRRCARLHEGDELRAGPYTLRLKYDNPPPGPASRRKVVPISAELVLRDPAPEPPAGLVGHGRTLVEMPGAAEAEVLSRLERMGQMQELMCGQFHDAMMMMMSQVVGNLKRDHAAGLREELEQIRVLTQEIQALRAATPTAAAAALPAATADAPAARTAAVPGPEPAARPGPAPLASEGSRAVAPSSRPDGIASSPEGERPRSDPVAAHAIANASLAAYERERQHRWKKVLKAMMSS